MADERNMVRMPPAGKFRMRLLQVYNWGTFDKLKRIPVARRGQLLVGASGAGKSTLLDAITALLIPPRIIDFNAAARDPGSDRRDRNLVSYIRGAWGEQTNRQSGEFGTQYMRDKDTFSSLALTFENDAGRATIPSTTRRQSAKPAS